MNGIQIQASEYNNDKLQSSTTIKIPTSDRVYQTGALYIELENTPSNKDKVNQFLPNLDTDHPKKDSKISGQNGLINSNNTEPFALGQYQNDLRPYEKAVMTNSYVQLAESDKSTTQGLKMELNSLPTKEIHFEVGSADISPSHEAILIRVAGNLKTASPALTADITGHTDSDDKYENNKNLSNDRALSLLNNLAGKGVGQDLLKPMGLSENTPRSTNSTDAGKADNRRADVTINYPSKGQ